MEPSFNKLEERLLRFLKEEFLEKGSKPPSNHGPATMERDVMEKFGLDPPQYREVMARFEHLGIAKAIAIGAKYGHVQINPAIVDIVRQLDEPNWVAQITRKCFSKKWLARLTIGMIVVGVIATFLRNVDTIGTLIQKWFGG